MCGRLDVTVFGTTSLVSRQNAYGVFLLLLFASESTIFLEGSESTIRTEHLGLPLWALEKSFYKRWPWKHISKEPTGPCAL